mmetsp:Transcript_21313/g.72185  ORF Transcript_21313/g.72185 Transcript_21313/m.72185 type:complete len:350 (+) Transcript_21313:282-1331(+)
MHRRGRARSRSTNSNTARRRRWPCWNKTAAPTTSPHRGGTASVPSAATRSRCGTTRRTVRSSGRAETSRNTSTRTRARAPTPTTAAGGGGRCLRRATLRFPPARRPRPHWTARRWHRSSGRRGTRQQSLNETDSKLKRRLLTKPTFQRPRPRRVSPREMRRWNAAPTPPRRTASPFSRWTRPSAPQRRPTRRPKSAATRRPRTTRRTTTTTATTTAKWRSTRATTALPRGRVSSRRRRRRARRGTTFWSAWSDFLQAASWPRRIPTTAAKPCLIMSPTTVSSTTPTSSNTRSPASAPSAPSLRSLTGFSSALETWTRKKLLLPSNARDLRKEGGRTRSHLAARASRRRR